jgi:8-oxo-dGTP pyrophosphatase MutT (NUDIX family)
MKIQYYAAAGGIITRGGKVLLLHKHKLNEFMLPKGHVEPGETKEEAALREMREETGYAHVRLLTNLGTLQARFERYGAMVVRDETYFLGELVDEARAEPSDYDDAAHDAENFRPLWVPVDEAAGKLSFEPARTFAARAADWLRANPAQPAA